MDRAYSSVHVMNSALQVSKRRAEEKVVENPLDSKAPAILRPVAPNGTALAKEALGTQRGLTLYAP